MSNPERVPQIIRIASRTKRRPRRESDAGWRLLNWLLACVVAGVICFAVLQFVNAYTGLLRALTDVVRTLPK